MSILYFCRIMPLVIRGFSWLFTRLMRISGAEALCAASNIFVGVESALTVKPYLEKMTRSELCTVMTAGMATVASNVLALYVYCVGDRFPNIAGHLVSASILSAPAALVMAKILVPEDETPVTLGRVVEGYYEREHTLFEAIINGAHAGMKLIFGIVALLLAALGLVASMAIFVGGVAAVAPSRTRDVADVALRALVAATLACLLTACVAGVFVTDGTILLGPLAR